MKMQEAAKKGRNGERFGRTPCKNGTWFSSSMRAFEMGPLQGLPLVLGIYFQYIWGDFRQGLITTTAPEH